MKIMITGHQGYVGPSVIRQLRLSYPGADLIGVDVGFFSHCFTGVNRSPDTLLTRQYNADVRTIQPELLEGVDAIVHLAAISNDPMGKTFESVTDEINCQSSVRLARLAKQAGVKSFVFASSCSVYGFAQGGARTESDPLNPLTAYAKSKIGTEEGVKSLAGDGFNVTCLRFATACGFSDRTRLDLVLNDFVAGAVAGGEITILSDGTPWRPLIHIDDMALAIDWAISRSSESDTEFLSINAGSNDWNYQVKQLADAVAEVVPDTKVTVNPNAAPDKRSYQVSFDRFRELAPDHQPRVTLRMAVEGLVEGLTKMNFQDSNFRESHYMRLNVLKEHMSKGRLNNELNWQ